MRGTSGDVCCGRYYCCVLAQPLPFWTVWVGDDDDDDDDDDDPDRAARGPRATQAEVLRETPQLHDLLTGLMHQNPRARYTLADAKAHPWTTKEGTRPLRQLGYITSPQRT